MSATASEFFFKRLRKNKRSAFSVVNKLVAAKEEENQWRDFKEAWWLRTEDGRTSFSDEVLPDLGKRNGSKLPTKLDELKNIWSEYLGAFANSGGGVLIWGIRAPSRKAESQSLAPDAEGLADWLREQQTNATDPPIQGVRIEAFREGDTARGFVVCHIPPSGLGPHRSLWSPGRYFARFDDGNKELTAPLLRRMFHPQVASFLVPHLKFTFTNQERGTHICCEVTLENRGMASAQNALVAIKANFGSVVTIAPANEWKERSYGSRDRINTDMVIHPGETMLCANVATGSVISTHRDNPDLTIHFTIYAANTSALEGSLTILGEEWESARINSHDIPCVVQMLQKA